MKHINNLGTASIESTRNWLPSGPVFLNLELHDPGKIPQPGCQLILEGRFIKNQEYNHKAIMEEMRKLIEKKDWEYALYQKGEQYELTMVTSSPPPGFDVFHVLEEKEVAAYESLGMEALQERIADMKENYIQYRHQSLR